MYIQLSRHLIRYKWRICHRRYMINHFHTTRTVSVVKPILMTDVGEGITECEIIQWFVEPERQVEEWDKLCEVTSDKTSVEITSRFTGVVKKLYYEPGEMAKVGKPLVDIDIQNEIGVENQECVLENFIHDNEKENLSNITNEKNPQKQINHTSTLESGKATDQKSVILATPAIRSLAKQLNVRIEDVSSTGKDGRVLKEDVLNFVRRCDIYHEEATSGPPKSNYSLDRSTQKETIHPLTTFQNAMFRNMAKSVSTPSFLYADEIDFSALSELRKRLNNSLAEKNFGKTLKLSFLPFIIKAVSISLHHYPILNARVVVDEASCKPSIVLRRKHNIGVAMDTPSGLLVPVIKDVSNLTVTGIASELMRLQNLAASDKLTSQDLSSGTITVSNIGSIGGTYVAPIIVENELAILGIGKVRTVPAFSATDELVKKQVCYLSWSADHRVIDGATLAKASEVTRGFLEAPDSMILHLN